MRAETALKNPKPWATKFHAACRVKTSLLGVMLAMLEGTPGRLLLQILNNFNPDVLVKQVMRVLVPHATQENYRLSLTKTRDSMPKIDMESMPKIDMSAGAVSREDALEEGFRAFMVLKELERGEMELKNIRGGELTSELSAWIAKIELEEPEVHVCPHS